MLPQDKPFKTYIIIKSRIETIVPAHQMAQLNVRI